MFVIFTMQNLHMHKLWDKTDNKMKKAIAKYNIS